MICRVFESDQTRPRGFLAKIEDCVFTTDTVDADIFIFTDLTVKLANKGKFAEPNKKRVALLIEPLHVNQHWKRINCYRFVLDRPNLFHYVLSYDQEFLQKCPDIGIFNPLGLSWISRNECKIYEKNKNTSIFVTPKKRFEGRRLRHLIANTLSHKIDFVKTGKIRGHKINLIKDFRFNIAIENSACNWYFTEKLIDCFLTGTIPIYYGSGDLDKFFNTDSILQFQTLDELKYILDNKANEKFYKSKIKSIEENLKISFEKYYDPWYHVYHNCIKYI